MAHPRVPQDLLPEQQDSSRDPKTGGEYSTRHPETGEPVGIVCTLNEGGEKRYKLTDGSTVSKEAWLKVEANRVQPQPVRDRPDTRPLQARVQELEQRLGTVEMTPTGAGDVARLEVRVTALEEKLAAAADTSALQREVEQLRGRLATLEGRIGG